MVDTYNTNICSLKEWRNLTPDPFLESHGWPFSFLNVKYRALLYTLAWFSCRTDHLWLIDITHINPLQACRNLTFNIFLQGHGWPLNIGMLAPFPIFWDIFIYNYFIIGPGEFEMLNQFIGNHTEPLIGHGKIGLGDCKIPCVRVDTCACMLTCVMQFCLK